MLSSLYGIFFPGDPYHQLKEAIRSHRLERTIDHERRLMVISFTNNQEAAKEFQANLLAIGFQNSLEKVPSKGYTSYTLYLTVTEYDTIMGQGSFMEWQNTLIAYQYLP